MRFAWDNMNIEEITHIGLQPWVNEDEGEAVQEYSIFMVRAGEEEGDYIGTYLMYETTPEAALANWNAVYEKLLRYGYMKADDLEHFYFYDGTR